MNASVLRFRRLPGHRFEAGRGRLAHLVNAYLDEMSKAVIGLVGHVLKRLGDGLMALFRYPAAEENDAEHTARHFDERGDQIERKGIRGEAFGLGDKRSRGRLLSRRRRRRSGARPGSTGHGGSAQLDPQPINAAMSTLAVQAAGAAAIAMASATAPSILPDDRFFDSLRFPAASRSTVALAIHIVRTG
jgi:class 3 adenylate cyclase